MNIREATLEDLDFQEYLENSSFNENRRSTRKSLRHSITSPHQKVFIAEIGQKRCGSITLIFYKKIIRVYSLAVLSEFAGRGVGTGLIEHAILLSRNLGIGTITLEADIHNTSLVKWYENFGFEAVKVIVDYYAKNEDAIKMNLLIDNQEKTRNIVVVDYDTDFFNDIPGLIVIRAHTYIEDIIYQRIKNVRIFNFCSNFNYQTVGYYVSLLAMARNHSIYPNIISLRDFKSSAIVKSIGDEIFEKLQKELSDETDSELIIDSCFGYCAEKKYQNLTQCLNLLYEAPLIRYHFVKKNYWFLKKVSTIELNKIEDVAALKSYAINYFSQKKFISGALNRYKYDLAILIDENEKKPPSCKVALTKFKLAAESLGFYVEFITKNDYKRIPEFNALFIRATTNVNNYTYDFSRYAYAEGLVVIDDPWSILKCSNKLYLFEALKAAGIIMPLTWMISKKTDYTKRISSMSYPLILKQPDSAFSLGVYKVNNEKECRQKLVEILKKSEIVIAQEYLPTEYDWRIGVLDKKPIYACKYYMAKGHWQIYNWEDNSVNNQEGGFETIPVEKVPSKVIKTALKAANIIGDGLYGVDLKEINREVYVIEINDNPSIESGVEDEYLQDDLYLEIIKSFYNRLDNERVTIRTIS